MYQQDYERKMFSLLEDNTYKVETRDSTTGIQKSTNALVERLYNLQLIDTRIKYRLPTVYHSLVPNVTAPTYPLSKFLTNVLQRSTHSEYNIKDNFEIAEYIRNITLRREDKFYIQLFGTAMGSPLSPVLADIVMNTLLDNTRRQIPFEMPVLKKFVDDLILVLPVDQVDLFNIYKPHIQFTKEEKIDGKLPFLDMIVTRNPDQILSTQCMKSNVTENLIYRVNRLSNNQKLQQQNQTVFKILRMNDYPAKLIKRLTSKMTVSHSHHNEVVTVENPPETSQSVNLNTNNNNDRGTSTENILYRSLPYVPVFSSHTTVKIIGNNKDPVEPPLQSNVVCISNTMQRLSNGICTSV
ncbi:uncharacterized protein LOC134288971 [Aedes albopictus]|uniref:Reverse transcriptase domain-containing protein n=1 Tax=Aedes albopictus TaxID=7160 RepID=A0ABM1YEH8_AEDAL